MSKDQHELVWEATVALALRDSQWMSASHQLTMTAPRSFIQISGNAEAGIGDGFFPRQDRYFIFELKAERASIASEWRLKDLDGKQQAAKAVHRAMYAEMARWHNYDFSYEDCSNVFQSLVGHFFVYWDEKTVTKKVPQSGLVVESYLRATASMCGRGDWGSWLREIDRRFRFGYPKSGQAVSEPGSYATLDRFPISLINADSGALIAPRTEEGSVSVAAVYQLGLTAGELQSYVDNILKLSGSEHSSIRAVVTNGDGSFARFVTQTSDLKKLFAPTLGPTNVMGTPDFGGGTTCEYERPSDQPSPPQQEVTDVTLTPQVPEKRVPPRGIRRYR